MISERPKIMGLTVYRPQSELMADGVKPVENRDWLPMEWMLGRYLALHASTRWDQEYSDFVQRNHTRFHVPPPRLEVCKTGIIAVAQLVGWAENTGQGINLIKLLPGHAFTPLDGRWFVGAKYAWLLRNVRRITPVPINGKQKLWALDPKTYDLVRNRYRRAEDKAAATVANALEQLGRPTV